MRNSFLALSLLASFAAISGTADAAVTTFTGLSTGVTDPDTGTPEQYRVSFTFDDSPSPYPVFHWVTTDAPFVPYDYAYYTNIVAFSVVGPRYDVSFSSGFSQVSTLDSSRSRGGNVGLAVSAGSDGNSIGYALGFRFLPQTAYADTSMPTSLPIASAFENGFSLTEYYYDGDPADEIITSRELLNFRFASGGIVPSATSVPEPATWAMMLVGFGAVGYGMRRRTVRTRVVFA